jgi:ribose transport system permease protein
MTGSLVALRTRSVTDRLPLSENRIIWPFLAVFVLISILEPSFATVQNVESILRSVSFIGIVAVGQAILIIAGEFDLSVGATAGLGAVVAGVLMRNAEWPVPIAVVGGLGAGILVGLVNGLTTVRLGVPSFITTLGMLFIARGIVFVLSDGQPVYPLPPDVSVVESFELVGLPASVWILLLLAIGAQILLARTVLGRRIYATGANLAAAKLAGIDVARIKIMAFIATGALASLAGMLLVSRLSRADAAIGAGWELAAIAGCVVGGVRLGGGAGTVVGAIIGVLLVRVVTTGLVFIGVPATLQPVVVGSVMIAAVAAGTIGRRANAS